MDLQPIKQHFNIIGNSPLLNRGIEIAMQVAITDLSVLIIGESGVGKEHFPKSYTITLHANIHPILPSTVVPSQKERLIANYSVMKKALLPMRNPNAKVTLR